MLKKKVVWNGPFLCENNCLSTINQILKKNIYMISFSLVILCGQSPCLWIMHLSFNCICAFISWVIYRERLLCFGNRRVGCKCWQTAGGTADLGRDRWRSWCCGWSSDPTAVCLHLPVNRKQRVYLADLYNSCIDIIKGNLQKSRYQFWPLTSINFASINL